MNTLHSIMRILFIVLTVFFLFGMQSCRKNSLTSYDTSIHFLKFYEDTTIATPVGVYAGSSTILCHYRNKTGKNRFMLTDLEGKFQRIFDLGSFSAPVTTILYEADHTYTIFRNDSLFSITEQGAILSRKPAFNIPGLDTSNSSLQYRLSKEHHYIAYGSMYTNTTPRTEYTVIADFDHDGQLIWFKLFDASIFFGSNYSMHITDSAFYLAANSFCKITRSGEIAWIKKGGSDIKNALLPFSKTSDLYCTHSFYNTATRHNAMRIYKIDQHGEITNSMDISFTTHFLAGQDHICLNSTVVKKNGDLFILIYDHWIPDDIGSTNIALENHSMIAEVGPDLQLKSFRRIQYAHPDQFNAVCALPNGQIAVFGRTCTGGSVYKPCLFFVD